MLLGFQEVSMNCCECKSLKLDPQFTEIGIEYFKHPLHGELFVFLDGLAKGYTPRAPSHTYRTIEWSDCTDIQKVAAKISQKRKGLFGNDNCQLSARMFRLSERTSADTALIEEYQRGKVNPMTFLPLDYLTQAKDSQEFLAVDVIVKMGDSMVSIAQYFCPHVEANPSEKPPVLVRLMSEEYFKVGLKRISDIFARIVHAESLDPADLKQGLAEFAYHWTLIQPYEKGGELGKRILSLLAKMHKYSVKLGDYEQMVFKSPYLPHFIKKFAETAHLVRD